MLLITYSTYLYIACYPGVVLLLLDRPSFSSTLSCTAGMPVCLHLLIADRRTTRIRRAFPHISFVAQRGTSGSTYPTSVLAFTRAITGHTLHFGSRQPVLHGHTGSMHWSDLINICPPESWQPTVTGPQETDGPAVCCCCCCCCGMLRRVIDEEADGLDCN